MKKAFILALLFASAATCLQAQTNQPSENCLTAYQTPGYIDVTGTAEMQVTPDIIKITIGISEYWQEEFEKRAKEENFKTKVPLSQIESELLKALKEAGVEKDMIVVSGAGSYGRQTGKDFLNAKQYEITLSDDKLADNILKSVDTRGIEYMRLSELDHSQIEKYKLDCSIKAIKAAQDKAEALLGAIGEKVGRVLVISESPIRSNVMTRNVYMLDAAPMMSAKAESASVESVRKIDLSTSVNVRFEIAPRQ